MRSKFLLKTAEGRLPLLLLLLAGLSLFLFQNQSTGFNAWHHGFLSSHGITLAKNLISDGPPLLMYEYREEQAGEILYHAYNRFPVVAFWLISLVIRPFEPDLAGQVYAARQLMNLFLLLTMIVSYKLVVAVVGDRAHAAIVTLLVMSTTYILRYGDMIFNDIPGLCAFVLALYAVVKAQKCRLSGPQLLLFALLPISISWQPYAVFLSWVLVEFVQLVLGGHATPRPQRVANFLRSPACIITCGAVMWGGMILGLQLFNEWRVSGGNLQALSSVDALLRRLGVADAGVSDPALALVQWDHFTLTQVGRLLLALVPFGGVTNLLPTISKALLIDRLVAACCLGTGMLVYLRYRPITPKVTLVLLGSGLLWAIGMRHFVAFHDFQAIYYIGFALALFISLVSRIPTPGRATVMIGVTLLFIISVYQSNTAKTASAAPLNAVTAEFQPIYTQLPAGSRVYIDGNRHTLVSGYHAVSFYLAGSIAVPLAEAEYAVSGNPNFEGVPLTANPQINLFKVNSQ